MTEIKTVIQHQNSGSFFEPAALGPSKNYQFAAQPKTIKTKSKYRSDREVQQVMGNTMYERHGKSANDEKKFKPFSSGRNFFNSTAKRPAPKTEEKNPLEDLDPQFDIVYEELNKTMDEEKKLIPDYYIDKPPTPEFRPQSPGRDISTQLLETDLFDFNLEVEPILQVVIGRVIEQSRMELIEEDEIRELKAHKALFEKQRNAELMVTQRMEMAAKRRKEERERRDLQHDIADKQRKIVHKKYLSLILAKKALSGAKPSILGQLHDLGFLRKDFSANLQTNYLPWLMNLVAEDVLTEGSFETLTRDLVIESEAIFETKHKQSIINESERKRKIIEERERLEKERMEAKRKRKQRKMAKRRANEKYKLMENIALKIFKYGSVVTDIFDATITDLTGEDQKKYIVPTLGGLVFDLWLCLHVVSESDPRLLSENLIHRVIINLLNSKVKTSLPLFINEAHRDKFDEGLRLMGDNLELFLQNKKEMLSELSEKSDLFLTKPALIMIEKFSILDWEIFRSMSQTFLEIIFKAVKPPEKAADPEKRPDDGAEPNLSTSVHHEGPSAEDLEILKSRDRLDFKFEQAKTFKPNYNAFVRVQIPLNRESPREDNVQEEPALEESKMNESFIEPYNGTSFEKDRQAYYEHNRSELKCYAYNLANYPEVNILLFDERSQYLIRKALMELILGLIEGKESNPQTVEQMVEKARDLSREIEWKIIDEVISSKDVTPILDFEF